MKLSLQKALSFVLVLVMVLGIIPFAAFANETQQASESVMAMDGLNISYPYNTETVKQTGSVPSRFSALTFESARNEVESAQVILSPDFDVTSFQLTMGSLQNENGNIIPSWAFEVFVQHYVSISGAGNAPYWTTDSWISGTEMFKPRGGEAGKGASGMFPDALIPMDAAITAGENKISAGKNGGLWVNLDVQDAAPGTYTGFATLNVNSTDMQIPVSVRIYDVSVPEEVHVESMFPVWWDQLQAAEGIDRNLADAYFEYLVSKRVMPMDAWNITRWDDAFVDYAASYLAVAPEISSYSLHFERNSDGTINETALTNTLTAIIDKNIELAQSGSDADLFKKAYFAFYDEPETSAEYKDANAMTAQLDKVKNALASKLDSYPELKASFMSLKAVVTAQHPDDSTYDKMWQDVGSTKLTGSYIYCPQFQYLNTETQRSYYANEEDLWWYGCCFPTEPFPTYHVNSPLIAARATGWMMYDYDIDGMLYSAVNYWGKYNNDGSITQLSYWTGYTDNGTPGDGMLVYPGSDYGVYGPIGTVRIENIRESFEDYEYLWLLENQFGADISAYTKGLYEGAIVTGVYDGQTIDPDGDGNTDAVTIHHNNRVALLTKLEQLNVAENGATQIAPGQEGFVRGEAFTAGVNFQVDLDQTKTAVGLSMDYKITDGEKIGVALLSDWTNFYGYYNLYAEGVKTDYEGVYIQKLDDGYVRVIFELAALTVTNASPTPNLDLLFVRGANTSASGYIDNVQLLDEIPEIAPPVTEPPVTEPPVTEPPATEPPQQVFEGGQFVAGSGITVSLDNRQSVTRMSFDYKLTSEGYMNVALLPDWSSYFGYFKLDANGESGDYKGVTTQKLADGYIRVYIDVADVDYIAGSPSDVITMIYVRGSYTTANGEITNIRLNDIAYEPFRGKALTPGVNQSIDLDATEEISIISFDYLITDDGKIGLALLPNWSSYFGYYDFDANGLKGNYSGVTAEVLEDGYVHVTMELDKLTNRAGDPSMIIDFIYIRGSYTTANGYIDHVQYILGCSHNYEAVVTNPDCENVGYTTYTCIKCGDSYTDNEVAALGHKYEAVVTAPSFTANGYTTNTCANCGHSYVSDEVSAYTYDVSEWNIALCDDIRANFHLSLDSRLADAQIVVLADGITTSYSLNELATTAEGYYVISVNLAAAQMTDEIAISVISGELESEAKTYSIRQYAEYVFAGNYDENTKLLVQRMLNYGAAAQTYFNYNTENMANAGYEMTDAPEISEADIGSVASGNVVGIDYYGASLLYETRVGVRFYFTVTGRIEDYTFTDAAGNIYEPVSKSGMYYVEVMNISPNAYDDAIEMSVTDGTNTLTVGYSPLRYISRKYYGSDAKLSALVGALYQYHQAAELYLNEDQEIIRGTAFEIATSLTQMVSATEELGTLSFEYKILSGNQFNIALMPDWSNFFGYFAFDGNGAVDTYDGVATEVLEDGYIRVTFDMAALTKFSGAPTTVIDFLYIRGSWSDAAGYIDNVQYTVKPKAPTVFDGGEFAPDTGATIVLENEQAISRMTFDYKIDSGEYFHIALMPDWSNFFGYFKFDVNGAAGTYPGVVTRQLDNGYIRVYVDLTAVTTLSGAPSDVITMLYVRGKWTTATGIISNICINEAAEYAPRGQLLAQKAGNNFVLKTNGVQNSAELTSLSFDYKIVSGEKFGVALMPDWSSYFGYFHFNEAGSNVYNGVSIEHLEDGYIRVTFDLTKLTLSAGTPSTAISMMYVRPDYCLADVYIDNIQFS